MIVSLIQNVVLRPRLWPQQNYSNEVGLITEIIRILSEKQFSYKDQTRQGRLYAATADFC